MNSLTNNTFHRPDSKEVDFLLQVMAARSAEEYEIIFEHSIAYLYRLMISNRYQLFAMQTVEPNVVLFEEENQTIWLFNPRLTPSELQALHNTGAKLGIRSISEMFLKVYPYFRRYDHALEAHSSEEAIFSTHKIVGMHGKDFIKLRTTINRLSKQGFVFKPTAPEDDIYALIETWHELQGSTKYGRDKREHDRTYVDFFMKHQQDPRYISRCVFDSNQQLVGLALVEVIQPNAAIYLVNKCLNGQNGLGTSGLSKLLYHQLMVELKDRNVSFVNTGSLGIESGARSVKLEFKPVTTDVSSYRILYN